MSLKPYRFFFILLIMLVTACTQAEPTPLFLPTSTPVPPIPSATPTVTATPAYTPATALPEASASSPTLLPMPTVSTTPDVAPTVRPTRTASEPTEVPVEPTEPLSPSQAQDKAFPPAIALEPVVGGFKSPVYLTYAGKTSPWASWMFVVERIGRIQLIENGQVQPIPFLDITDRVGSGASEQGLLSVAFPPDFETSGVFYVDYTDRRGDTIIARYGLLERDPPQGDPASEQKILEIAQPAANHNGGQLQFGADGYLYIGTGDGGRAGDPWGNAQNPNVLLGKMLRVDVRGADTYRVPADNPFVGWSDVRPEIWSLGLRNPWRFSFDRATGDLYIADVGQNVYEEVDFQPAHSTGGENYGWDVMEGEHCFEPSSGCDSNGLISSVVEYDHSLGCSVTGGYVYRGTRYPEMVGVYFYGDFCSGRIWGLQRAPSGEWRGAPLLDTNASISSFGEDAAGELYVLNYGDGTVYHLIAAP